MDYTIEQKRDAFSKDKLWWRFPSGEGEYSKQWSKMSHDLCGIEPSDFVDPDAEYFIGDTPPRVLSELERELLEALEQADADFAGEGFCTEGPYRATIRAAIAKAKGEA